MASSKEYRQGIIGFLEGKSNPHPPHTIRARDWALGYSRARSLAKEIVARRKENNA